MTFSNQIQDVSALDLEPLKVLIEERVRIPCCEEAIEREARSWRLSQVLMPFLLIGLVVGTGIVLASQPMFSWAIITTKTVLTTLFLTYILYRFRVSAVRAELRERVSSPIDVLLGYYYERLGRYRTDLISGDGWLATIKKGRPYDDTIPPGAVSAHVQLCERCDELIRRLTLTVESCDERLKILKSALRMWAMAPSDQQTRAWTQVVAECSELDREVRHLRAVWLAAKRKTNVVAAVTTQSQSFLEALEDALNAHSESLPPDVR